ncbi:TonB-dependent receptor [Kordiimonas sp. SCSIO 12610]|uniref:TonB-dependent receptor n=1 Tax=Kordiimonas sp. SCSIO 12610 TaxID=2829597 RepID=UPI0021086D1B|nr:TonB-dependent receptor [Kordiimonas sp. SCSIO 12610]UTW55958.1 TonB-dependent receptor [Kordiimonas sp. SCSIO 12610]
MVSSRKSYCANMGALCAIACLLCPTETASAFINNDNEPIEEIVIHGRAIDLIGAAKSGSEGVVGYADLEKRPFSRVGELVEVIPGLVATQHSGTGKANQFFLRGFNLDHGTDFAAFVDGTPINFRTHGHGQGYLDLNFIIPELTERIDFRKGPYFADVGDFSAAATSSFKTYDKLDNNLAQVTVGESGFFRGLIATSFEAAGGDLLLAGEAAFFDSPFILDEDLEKLNAFLKYSRTDGGTDWRLSLSAYDAEWTSSDQVPLRAIESGLIPRLGFIDPDLGGETTRIALNGGFDTENLSFSAYALYYDFTLFSNFTLFLNNPVNGDEFEQRDERITLGGTVKYRNPVTLFGKAAELRVGGDIRYDDIFNIGLFNTAGRERLSTVRDDEVSQFSIGGYAEVEVNLTDHIRASAGLRGDVFTHDVVSSIDVNSGDGSDAIITPTASIAWQAFDRVEFYANYGQGFHSNDVRGASITVDPVTREAAEPVDVLVRAEGAEIGVRLGDETFNTTLVGFWLDLDSELVFVGDAGTTEPNDDSRRFGVEFNAFWQPLDWLVLDATAAYTDARFRGAPLGEARIPQAVESVLGGGITVKPGDNFSATLRLRHFGEAPLIEDGSVFSEPTTLVNVGIYKDIGPARFSLDILNLFDSEDADITYFFESQLPGEAAPVADIHLKPVEPRQIRASLSLRF